MQKTALFEVFFFLRIFKLGLFDFVMQKMLDHFFRNMRWSTIFPGFVFFL